MERLGEPGDEDALPRARSAKRSLSLLAAIRRADGVARQTMVANLDDRCGCGPTTTCRATARAAGNYCRRCGLGSPGGVFRTVDDWRSPERPSSSDCRCW